MTVNDSRPDRQSLEGKVREERYARRAAGERRESMRNIAGQEAVQE
jgi:hypothetical protein